MNNKLAIMNINKALSAPFSVGSEELGFALKVLKGLDLAVEKREVCAPATVKELETRLRAHKERIESMVGLRPFRRPEFITFTGLDEHTDLVRAGKLSEKYPIEWGVLLSPKLQGQDQRYPGPEVIRSIEATPNLRLSGHICGAYSRQIMNLSPVSLPVRPDRYTRFQINTSMPSIMAATSFQTLIGRSCILQSRDHEFPAFPEVHWLFDKSGGEGIVPLSWPPHPGSDHLVGYAGGISPTNVKLVIETIRADGPYWLDMESGVRTGNWLDLGKCEAVCEMVFGDQDGRA